jgi:hypothetical protein
MPERLRDRPGGWSPQNLTVTIRPFRDEADQIIMPSVREEDGTLDVPPFFMRHWREVLPDEK